MDMMSAAALQALIIVPTYDPGRDLYARISGVSHTAGSDIFCVCCMYSTFVCKYIQTTAKFRSDGVSSHPAWLLRREPQMVPRIMAHI